MSTSVLVGQQDVGSLTLYRATVRFQVESSEWHLNPSYQSDLQALYSDLVKTPIFIRGTWPPKLLGQVTADVRLLALYQLAAGTDLSTNMTAEELSLSLAAAYPYAQARNQRERLRTVRPIQSRGVSWY